MRWFEGSIAEAVAACKARRAVFVVFVEGQDDASKNTLATLEDNTISSSLESEEFIVIKVDSRSESYRQFVQIYQLVPVPSLFFIGANGTPLEVVAGEVDVPGLTGRITSVLAKCGKTSSQDKPVASEVPANGPLPSTSSTTTSPSVTVKQSEPVASEPLPSTPSSSASPSITEKVERAKELIEKKKQQKQEEEERAERNRELERRRVGQEVQKLRKWQQEQEVKELKEQRRKEKMEEQAARQRVLDQINQDRAERAARATTDSSRPQSEPREEPRLPSSPRSDVARIQFRLPDGSSHTHSFSADTPLAEVRAYAASNLDLPFRDFAMSTTFPRREFTSSDDSQSVSDLELVPTAVILILPASSSAVVNSPGYFDVMTRMIWTLLAPLAALITYMRDLVSRRGGSPGDSGSQAPNPAPSSGPENTRQAPVRRRTTQPDSTSSIQRQGNIHRLTTRRDSSDDENNTWNGNSTQQM